MWNMDISFLTDALDGDGSEPFDIKKFDMNKDGFLDANDCPFPHGSPEAKLWFKNILEPHVKGTMEYMGKPLVPGEAGPGQGDFDYLVAKIQITQGLSYFSAAKIAGKVKAMMYAG